MKNMILDLPKDKNKIVTALLEKVENNYKEDVALVVCYGSYVTGTANAKSDLDFYYVPKTQKAYELCKQFIIDDIGYDFWPISWERAQRFADFEEPLASLIADAEVIYYYDDEDLKRYNILKDRISELTNHINLESLISKAEKLMIEVKALYYDAYMKKDDYQSGRIVCSEILNKLLTVVAYLNGTYLKKGVSNVENEVRRFTHLPVQFLKLYEQIIMSEHSMGMLEAMRKSIENVCMLIEKLKPSRSTIISNDTFKGFYEELKSIYNKLVVACDSKDFISAFFAVNSIEHETRSIFGERYDEFDFPSLLIPMDKDNFELIKALANRHEEKLVSILERYSVDIDIYDDVDEFIKSLQMN